MIEVTKKVFFSVIGPMNVHPTATGRTSDEPHGMYSIFRTPNGTEVGRSYNKPTERYMLADSYDPQNSAEHPKP